MGFWSRLFGRAEEIPSRVIDPDRRFDAWQNPITGLNTPRDKVTAGTFWAPFRLQDSELLALYNGSDIAATIVECWPKEMMKRGYELAAPKGVEVDQDEVEGVTKYADRLRANELFTDGAVWGNLFGGALLIMGAEDGRNSWEPLREDAIRSVRFLNLIDRRFIYVHTYYSDPMQPNYGLPETYLVTRVVSASGSGSVSGTSPGPAQLIIHESRCIRFDGARTDVLTRQQLSGWSWSTLQRAYDKLRQSDMTFDSVAHLMSDASQAVFKMQGLINMIASGEKDVVMQRMALVDQSRSVLRAVLLDAEMEEFERSATSFAGMADLLDRFMMRLSAATDGIPVTKLFGRSAAGMNATGENDMRGFYDEVEVRQGQVMTPRLQRLYYVISCAQDCQLESLNDVNEADGDEDSPGVQFDVRWRPVRTPSDVEQADVEYKTAQKDQIYATIGALTPEEIALSRWGKGRFSTDTVIDVDAAKARQSDEKMFGSMMKPPEMPGNRAGEAPGMGEQQTTVTPLPGPNTNTGEAGTGAPTYGQMVRDVDVDGEQKPRRDALHQDAITHRVVTRIRFKWGGEPLPESEQKDRVWSRHHSFEAAKNEANIDPHPTTRIEEKKASGEWEEVKHPRDEQGRFA